VISRYRIPAILAVIWIEFVFSFAIIHNLHNPEYLVGFPEDATKGFWFKFG